MELIFPGTQPTQGGEGKVAKDIKDQDTWARHGGEGRPHSFLLRIPSGLPDELTP